MPLSSHASLPHHAASTTVRVAAAAASFSAQPKQEQQEQPQQQPPYNFCDVCWGRRHKQNMIFQVCQMCQVGVHNECYGIRGDVPADVNFVCHACRAIGTTVKVRQREEYRFKGDGSNDNNRNRSQPPRMQFEITQRPTECCLCSVDDTDDWYHAMHPVYDHYGPTGRHLVLPPNEEHDVPRLAWAHTLCALVISAHPKTNGCVYGCNRYGNYDGEGEDDENSDTSSINSDLDDDVAKPAATASATYADDSIHHFAYCLRLKNQPDNDWTRAIKSQQALKCQICGSDDQLESSFCIAHQCSANDEHEYVDFARCHGLLLGEPCYVPIHAGCAMWGRNDVGELPTNRRVFYFPGRDKRIVQEAAAKSSSKKSFTAKQGVTRAVTNLYCAAHAQDLVNAGMAGSTTVRYPAHLIRPQRAAATAATIAVARLPGNRAKRPREEQDSTTARLR